jgi:septum formation protein
MSLWLSAAPLVLASQSPSRQALLRNAGIPLDIRPADINERAVETQSAITAPDAIALHLARAKALAVSALMPGRVVLGADQTLALDERRFSKPHNTDDAAAQLTTLAGRTHELHSAVVLARGPDIVFSHVAQARLTMRPLSAAFITAYLAQAGDAVFASVGAYQLEALGVHLFEAIEGDHFTILGLPLLPLLMYLRREGMLRA